MNDVANRFVLVYTGSSLICRIRLASALAPPRGPCSAVTTRHCGIHTRHPIRIIHPSILSHSTLIQSSSCLVITSHQLKPTPNFLNFPKPSISNSFQLPSFPRFFRICTFAFFVFFSPRRIIPTDLSNPVSHHPRYRNDIRNTTPQTGFSAFKQARDKKKPKRYRKRGTANYRPIYLSSGVGTKRDLEGGTAALHDCYGEAVRY